MSHRPPKVSFISKKRIPERVEKEIQRQVMATVFGLCLLELAKKYDVEIVINLKDRKKP